MIETMAETRLRGRTVLVPEERAAELGGAAVGGDLAAPDAATRLFDAAGPVDVLVNNAAHAL